MNEMELEAIKRAFGLSHITDSLQLRREIEQRFSQMNVMERAAVQMKIGMRLKELDAQLPGAKYSPATWSLAVTALIFAILAAGLGYAIVSTTFRLVVKVIFGALAVLWFVMAWRATARILFRLANGRDM
jgi:hypothetical protein